MIRLVPFAELPNSVLLRLTSGIVSDFLNESATVSDSRFIVIFQSRSMAVKWKLYEFNATLAWSVTCVLNVGKLRFGFGEIEK